MSDRVNSNARIPEDLFDRHTRNVQEKHAADSLYMGIEAELAIREYLDQDDLATLEEKLRDRCTSLGSSPSKRKKLVADIDSSEKKKAQWRIRAELKEELKKYAKETDNTYSDVFALAIREHWTNSRADRLEALYERLDNAIEPWADQIGNDGVNATIKDRRTAEIAMELDDLDQYLRDDLETAIAEVTSDSDYNKNEYTPRVAEYMGVEEHPATEDIFVSHERAAEIRASNDDLDEDIFDQSFDELTPDDRVLRVRARVYQKAESSNGKASMAHNDILDEFDSEPGGTTAYNIMGRASEAAGYSVASPHGTKKLRCNTQQVDDRDVIETAGESSNVSTSESVSSELDEITSAEPVH